MSQSCAPQSALALQQVHRENVALQQYLAAQNAVIAQLENRAGRSLELMTLQLKRLTHSLEVLSPWDQAIDLIQREVSSLSDLIADATLLQKLEAGKVDVRYEHTSLPELLELICRPWLSPKDGSPSRLTCEIAENLPPVWIDRDLTEATLTDLLARSLRYSDPTLPIIVKVFKAQVSSITDVEVQIEITAERFAPSSDRDFATEILLCCRRIEVQQGSITCAHLADSSQRVEITLPGGERNEVKSAS